MSKGMNTNIVQQYINIAYTHAHLKMLRFFLHHLDSHQETLNGQLFPLFRSFFVIPRRGGGRLTRSRSAGVSAGPWEVADGMLRTPQN